jgi:hypothetical protein
VSKVGQGPRGRDLLPDLRHLLVIGLRRARPWPVTPTPCLVSRASARVVPSSSWSEISTGQLSTVVMAAYLLPDAGATVLRLAVTPPSSARRDRR